MLHMDYKKDISPCPRCGKVPTIICGRTLVYGTSNEIDTFCFTCCGLGDKTWISKSYAILKWNIIALNPYSKVYQLEFNFK
jgi:hypothetical protein